MIHSVSLLHYQYKQKIKPYIYNDKEIQNYNSSACGYYCIAFIKFLHNKTDKEESFLTFLKLFNIKTHHNDKILYDLLYGKIFSRSKKFKKFILNLSFKLPVFRSIKKKLGGVLVLILQADFIIDESTSAIL
jgi:hypothetical protein